MGKGNGKKDKNNKNKNQNGGGSSSTTTTTNSPPLDMTATGDGIYIDPIRIRYQHSKIRPIFSGCGRSLDETLNMIRNKEMKPSDLPPIQVIIGTDEDTTANSNEPWYFSLNNRRLWIFKKCREEGILEETNNLIWVRVRQPKSLQEKQRYTIQNCSLDAKVMPLKTKKNKKNNNKNKKSDKKKSDKGNESDKDDDDDHRGREVNPKTAATKVSNIGPTNESSNSDEADSDDDESDDEDDNVVVNRFSALML